MKPRCTKIAGVLRQRGKPPEAFALVIVLITLVLCAGMIVLLLDRGTTSLQSASASVHSGRLRALGDMALHRVQAQIKEATLSGQAAGTPLAQRHTWASQPGALRVYQPGGTLETLYKLYSAPAMQTDDPDLSGDIPAQWHTRPAEYTDLNAPVFDGSAWRYPIVHPGAAAALPGAKGLSEGFEIRSTAPVAPAPGANTAPMPARWIYVLEDGTLCQLGDPRIDLKSNPIVGRIAFWTDDETSKVNLNTASPASAAAYWDTPRAFAATEHNTLALGQPSQNEYQRYPGHPAMVSLRPLLGTLGNLSAADYFALSPRYRWGGSEEGAKKLADSRTSLLTNKEDRAYASVDELLFQSKPTEVRTRPTAQQTEALRFFLTTSSRAPELNLFGQPRVSIWPVYGDPAKADPGPTRRTPYDQLLAFSSTLGGKPYHFSREQPLSATHDFAAIPRNGELYAYLQRLTSQPFPGFGGPAFSTKYPQDRDQILTEIFDYIRIVNLNETYRGRDAAFQSYTPYWKRATSGEIEASNLGNDYGVGSPILGAGLVVPIQIGDTRGIGRFPAITEVGLLFVTHAEKMADGTVDPPVPEAPSPENPLQLEAMLVFETTTPAFGYLPWCGKDFVFEVESSSVKFGIGTREAPLLPPEALGANGPVLYPPLVFGGHTPGGYDGACYAAGLNPHAVAGAGNNQPIYRFLSAPLNLQTGDTEFFITGGEIRVNLRVGGDVVQSYTFEFPAAAALPLPVRNLQDFTVYSTKVGRIWWAHRFPNEGYGPLDGDVLHSIQLKHGDARLVSGRKEVPKDFYQPHKDYGKQTRFAHGMGITRNSRLESWNGGSSGTYVDLALFDEPAPVLGAQRSDRRRTYRPKLPAQIKSLRQEGWSGDFDNGWSLFADGPFINKPDEGMMPSAAGTVPYQSFKWALADGLFSPLRQIPSAVMFGSLPTGVKAGEPWQTLLFCPNPANPSHPGFAAPADYLLLDLFRMPVVEPYAISSPAATDGKINLNYAIAPYSYLRRASAWYALLESLQFFAVPDAQSKTYKSTTLSGTSFRHRLDIGETLSQFEKRFASNALFRSAAEICSLFLVPQGQTLAGVENLSTGFWSSHRLTGDNSREKPYAELYPKLTTQSNTYRIHYRVQLLPRAAAAPTGRDFKPLAEYRGSRLFERYLDPEHPQLTSLDPDADSLNPLYQFRTLETSRFAP